MIWPGGHGMVFFWPGKHGTVHGMACRAWHSIWYGLGGRGVVYGITCVDMA